MARVIRRKKARHVEDHTADVRAFIQHGFVIQKQMKTQVVGKCPFADCQKDEHFYVNPQTHKWDCKSCGREGGFQLFLQKIHEQAMENFIRAKALALGKNRGLRVTELRRWDIGYNESSACYTIPVYYADGTNRIFDLRHARIGQALKSTKGCNLGLLGWKRIEHHNTIWICEGEWDCIAFDEALRDSKADGVCVAVPGANTFKQEWAQLFEGKKVRVLFDNDDPGRKGSERVYNRLRGIAKDVSFLHWEKGTAARYDIRDLVIDKSPTDAYKKVIKSLYPTPQGLNAEKIEIKESEVTKYDGRGLLPATVYEKYAKWLYLPDTAVIDVMFGTVIAQRMSGDPLWLFLVGPPGSAKTELILSFSEAPNTICKSSLASKTLVSGQIMSGGADPSLLPKLHGRVLFVEDFTTILTMPQVFREELFGILRSAYTGKFERDYGNGKVVRYKTHFGLICGVTPAIEQHSESSTALGERFLNFHMRYNKRKALERAVENTGKEAEMRAELMDAANKTLNYNFDMSNFILTKTDTERLMNMAHFTAILRGVVPRDRITKDITHLGYSEVPTRLVKQLGKLLRGVTAFHRLDTPQESQWEGVIEASVASVPSERLKIIELLHKEKNEQSTRAVADYTKLPSGTTCRRLLETLSLLGAVQKVGAGLDIAWTLNDEFAEILELSRIYS